jgi:hypothetical protein
VETGSIITARPAMAGTQDHVFIDESGNFTGYHPQSVSVVGALAILEGNLPRLRKKYARIRQSLLADGDEVKGRDLDAAQINRVVRLIKDRDAIFEVTAVDLELHTAADVAAYQQQLAADMQQLLPQIPDGIRERVAAASNYIGQIPAQLFLQALMTFDLMHRVIGHTALFFSQRKPYTLREFNWVIDGKNPDKVTKWENWLEFYARGALASLSARDPAPRPEPKEGALLDFTYFDKAHTGQIGDQHGIDPALLLKHVRFSSDINMGLEIVDILCNATRRMLRLELDRAGWINLHKLMIDRNATYIKFPIFQAGPDVVQIAVYGAIVNAAFRHGGRPMFTRRNQFLLD